MALDLFSDRGVPLDRQLFNWRDLVRSPISKLNDDAFIRVRVLLMAALEQQSVRFQHAAAQLSRDIQLALAQVRRVEHYQATLLGWLMPPDMSPLETTIAHEQMIVEVVAGIAQAEPDPALKQVYRFGLAENVDHLYRFSALLDRLEGKDANNVLQSYTDIRPGRPTSECHRAPEDDLREGYTRAAATSLTKVHALTALGCAQDVLDHCMTLGPRFSDPVARQLFAEIGSVKEQHVTQYESLINAEESLLEKWLLHEATEVYCYYSCLEQESNPRIKEVWDRFLRYELGHLHFVMDVMRKFRKRDPAEFVPKTMPQPLDFTSHREFIRRVVRDEAGLRANGAHFVPKEEEANDSASRRQRQALNFAGSPSEIVAAGYRWLPGTELSGQGSAKSNGHGAPQGPRSACP